MSCSSYLYRLKDQDLNSNLNIFLKDALELYAFYRGNNTIKEIEEFKFLCRMLKEQPDQGRIRPSKPIAPDSLQNPTDSDATYRKKGKKKHIGYNVNLVEGFDDKNRIITHYDLKKTPIVIRDSPEIPLPN